MADCRQCADFDWCAEHEDCGLFKPKPTITNADCIRAMSDEELAEFLDLNDCPPRRFMGDYDCKSFKGCRSCWLDWLKLEVSDG